MKYRILTTMLAWSLIPAGLPLSASGQPAGLEVVVLSRDKPVDFALEILPIFRKNCLACHNARDTEGDLNLETPATIAKGGESGAVVVPGKAGESLLMRHVRQIEKPFMPPRRNKVSAKKLSPRQLGLVESWIDEGAKGEVAQVVRELKWRPIPFALAPIYATAISPDGQYAAAGRGNQIFVYHLPTRRLAARLADPGLAKGNATTTLAHRDVVQSLAFSPDGQTLASGGYRVAKLWRRQPPSVNGLLNLLPGGETVTAIGVAPGQARAVAAGSAGGVQAIDLPSRMPLWRDHVPGQAARQLAMSPSGNRVAVLFADGRVRTWETATGERITRESSPMAAQAIAWLSDGQLATVHPGGALKIWAAINPGKVVNEWKPGGDITALAALPGGAKVLLGRTDNKLVVLNVGDGKVEKEIDHGAPITGLRVRVDGKQVATLGGPTARLWDTDKWASTAQLHGNPLATETVARAEQTLAFVKAEVGYHKASVGSKEKDLKKDNDAAKKATDALAKHEKTLADKTKEKTNAEADLKKLAEETAALPKKIEMATKAKAEADATLKAAKALAAKAKDSLAKASEAKTQAAAAKVKLSSELMELGSAAQNAAKLAAEARTVSGKAKDDKTMATQAEAVAALAKRKAAEFEAVLDRHAPTKQQLAKAATELQTATQSLAAAEAKVKPAEAEHDGKTKALAALEERKKKTPEEKKNLDKKIVDAGGAIDKATREIDLAKSEVGFTGKNVKTAEANLEKARVEQAEAGKLPAEREAALAEAKSIAAAGMQECLDATYSADGSLIYTLSIDGRVQAWATTNGPRSHPVAPAGRPAQFIRLLSDGRLALAGGSPEMAVLATEPEWSLAQSVGGDGDDSPIEDRVIALDFSPDGQRLATGGGFPSRGGEIYIWNVEDGSEVLRIPEAHSDTVCSLVFSPDGSRLASGGTDRFARIFETNRGRELRALEGHTGHVLGVSWQRNGRVLASVGADKAVKIWNLLNGEQKKSFGGFKKEVTSVHFLGIGTQALVSAGDNVVKVLKEDGVEVRRLPDTGSFMHTSDVTPDGKLAVGGGFDGILRVWEVNTGKLIQKFNSPPESTKVAARK
jgi:WD40 repeat protein